MSSHFAGCHVALADVHAVGVRLHGKRHVVIEHERHAVLPAERLERNGLLFEVRFVEFFFAQLQKRCAALQCLLGLRIERLAVQP